MPARGKEPTPRQLDCLRAIVEYQAAYHRPPTFREVQEAMGLASPSSVAAHITRLGRLGMVSRDPKLSRTIVVLEAGREALERGQ